MASIPTMAKSVAVALKGMHSRRINSQKRHCRRTGKMNKGRLPTAATTKDIGTSEAIGFCGYMKTFEGALHS